MSNLEFSETLGDSQTDTTYQGTADLIKSTKNIVINSVCYDLDVFCNQLENGIMGQIKPEQELPPEVNMRNYILKDTIEGLQGIIQRYKDTYLK